jgi:hypothetical protein
MAVYHQTRLMLHTLVLLVIRGSVRERVALQLSRLAIKLNANSYKTERKGN